MLKYEKPANGKKGLVRNILILVFSILFLVAGGGCIYVDSMIGSIHFVTAADPAESGSDENIFDDAASAAASAASGGTAAAKAGIVNGLYHDDAVMNILLLGTDDYQENDTGRSDSMMLVSIDTRHKKLKITSFMRDSLVEIPGIGQWKLTEAFSRGGGGTDGARKVVATIESNFGIDIDRFATVDFSAFPTIIDRLGGVEIELLDERDSEGRTEADLINQLSGDPGEVHTGWNNLSGLQARYYSRIRDIGNDFERTERQRKVFSAAIDKLKASNAWTIRSVLADVLPLVTTNMTPDEVISLAANAMTYVNYPLSQYRVPPDGEWYIYDKDDAKGNCVAFKDLAVTKKNLAAFLYEDDLPTGDLS
jgi:LCP family protein required for cell wall assembly